MRVIGLTGGIGSGKSKVAEFLKELGAEVVDLDKVGHDILIKGGEVYNQVLSAFGEGVLFENGEIDRARLAGVVFNDPKALKRLNDITHPAIDKKVEEKVQESRRKGAGVVVFEAAAMLESDRSFLVDELWVITAPLNAVLKRLKDRPGYSDEEARRRIGSQLTDRERVKKADVVIANEGTLEELRKKVKKEWDRLRERL
jgi:dephospho-CoA kinase